MRDGAPLDRLHRAKAGGDTEQRHTQGMGGCGGGHGIGDVMGAEQVQLNALHAFRAVQVERRAAAGIGSQVTGVEIGAGVAQRKRQHFAITGACLPDTECLVVKIENGDAIGIQPFDDLALGFDDFVRAAELADVGGPGIVENGHVRPGQADGVGNFTQARGAQFDHGSGVFRCQFEQGQRHAEVVVQVATGRQHRTTGAQNARKHLLDRGLAAGTGDGRDRMGVGGAIERAQLTEGLASVADQ
ncbi:hypothetical protein D3C72_1413280 [compost metagenome]